MSDGQTGAATIAFEQVEKGFDGRAVLDKVSFTVAREKHSASWAEAEPAKV
jgi:ABC-type transporter Mla maintaining outer membrane lipid asymmetry ATPase subunit MlaF